MFENSFFNHKMTLQGHMTFMPKDDCISVHVLAEHVIWCSVKQGWPAGGP
jgi:hypothetical protein